MDSVWITLNLPVFAFAGALLKYLVWDFFQKPEWLHKEFGPKLAQAKAFIHERKFLPLLEDIVQAVIVRKEILQAAPVIQILTEISIDADVRQAALALTERIELDRSFQRAVSLCPRIAASWLVMVLAGLSVFLTFQYSEKTVRVEHLRVLIGIVILFFIIGWILLGLFWRACRKFERLIQDNQY